MNGIIDHLGDGRLLYNNIVADTIITVNGVVGNVIIHDI